MGHHTDRVAQMHGDYSGGMSLAEVGDKWGVSRQRVHQLFTAEGLPTRARPKGIPRERKPRPTRIERFWAKVDKNGPIPTTRPDLGPCWLWTGGTDRNDYPQFLHGKAHRFAYELLVGSLDPALTVDHLCRVRRCVNPMHLEPVTLTENVLRGWEARQPELGRSTDTHCRRGHPWSEHGVQRPGRSGRYCRMCKVEANRARRAA